jgi:hypothetical protein
MAAYPGGRFFAAIPGDKQCGLQPRFYAIRRGSINLEWGLPFHLKL